MGDEGRESSHIVPITLQVESPEIGMSRACIPFCGTHRGAKVYHVAASLAELEGGTFTIEVRDIADGDLIQELSWTEPGVQRGNSDYEFTSSESGVRIDVTSLGTNPKGCSVAVWTVMTR